MAKNTGNGDAAKHEAQAAAQGFLKELSTPVADAQSLDEMFSVAANAVLVNVGTWVVPKRIPTEADFASRVELAFQDTPVLKSDEDYSSLLAAVVAVHEPVSHDRRKFVYSEALRIAAEKFITEQNAPVTTANVEAVIKQFREISGEMLPKVARRITAAINDGVLKLRRDRRQTGSGEKAASIGSLDLGKL